MQNESKINEQFSRENTSHGCGKWACGCFILGNLVVLALVILTGWNIYKSGKGILEYFRFEKKTSTTTGFQEFIAKSVKVNKLVLLETRTLETITRNMHESYKIPLTGKEVSDNASVTISCPVHFTYYVDLKGQWRLTRTDSTLLVEAPGIQIARPAIEVGQIKRKIDSGWLVFGEKAALEQLEKELTVQLRARAMLPENIAKVRKECAESLNDYIKVWLSDSSDKVRKIIIVFRNDTSAVFPYSSPAQKDKR